jgi:hypothetical protein
MNTDGRQLWSRGTLRRRAEVGPSGGDSGSLSALSPLGKLIPRTLKQCCFKGRIGVRVIAETVDRGHRRTLGPAVVLRHQGKRRAIYIGSGLEAIYEETLVEAVRACWGTLLEATLKGERTYDVEFRLGLIPNYMASPKHMLLHLLSNSGIQWKKLLAREQFLPLRT